MRRLIMISISLLGCFTPVAGRDRSKADCQWPQEPPVPLDLRIAEQKQHLSDDAWRAEDLAIRYADSGKWKVPGQPVEPDDYGRTRDKCMAALFSAVAKNHGVT